MKRCQNSDCNKSLEKVARYEYRKVEDSYFCVKCYRLRYSQQLDQSASELQPALQPNISTTEGTNIQNNVIELNLPIAINDHKKCVFGCIINRALRCLSRQECLQVFVKTNIFVKYGAKCCIIHGQEESLVIPDNFSQIKNTMSLTADEVVATFNTFKRVVLNENNKETKEVSFANMTDKQLSFEIKLNKVQFNELLNSLPTECSCQ